MSSRIRAEVSSIAEPRSTQLHRALSASLWAAALALSGCFPAVSPLAPRATAVAKAPSSSPPNHSYAANDETTAGRRAAYAARAAALEGRAPAAPDIAVGSLLAYGGDLTAMLATPSPALDSDEAPPRISHPNYNWSMDYYQDSDQNRVLTLSSETSLSMGPLAAVMHTDEVQASDPSGKARAGDRVISLWGNLTEGLAVGGGLGNASTGDGWSTVIGAVQTSMNLASAQLQLSSTHEMLEANAQTIRNHVQETDLDARLSDYNLTEHLGGSLEYHHRLFSDGNSSNELNFSPQYRFKLGPGNLSLGYSFRYINYAKLSALGYWAPSGLLMQQGQAAWNLKWRNYYSLLQLGLGRSFEADTSGRSQGFSGSGTFGVGWHIAKNMLAESYFTAGRDALGQPAGWSSMSAGCRFNWSF